MEGGNTWCVAKYRAFDRDIDGHDKTTEMMTLPPKSSRTLEESQRYDYTTPQNTQTRRFTMTPIHLLPYHTQKRRTIRTVKTKSELRLDGSDALFGTVGDVFVVFCGRDGRKQTDVAFVVLGR